MKISRPKIYEQIANRLIEQIESGVLKEGERLPSIQKLAEDFGVSNASVREALNALRIIGLIEMKHGYGTFVKQKTPQLFDFITQSLTPKRVKEILELREVVELSTAQFAAERRTDAMLEEMEHALSDMRNAIQTGESGEEADLRFHLAIAKASDNQLLYELLHNISDLIQQTMKGTRHIYLYNRQKTMERLFHEHTAILEAIQQQDGETAMKNMACHLAEVRQTLIDHYIVD
ncbi:FadR family transcriptional regulator [Staphylococcus muscae]|uniref:GntR family transcriptional regulator n=1 Tax=Staphylococcus muscae TaxID=1294 RepID=A0A240C677_9STAP|nr:FadR/GntR family transcriptional regulator [Staphylococcus muscae]AVQ33557.1 FadR family transcriptional regulator [Staphylococcus muscae]PNZ06118.1 FadR family transcriptional regulator [Staphylococcus muscae]GGA91440.1 GntR family transcriptional regulator [Staphylococcus muscae]SNW03517.1 GntR family transcriptional regulator [Staphylococcus muscae]